MMSKFEEKVVFRKIKGFFFFFCNSCIFFTFFLFYGKNKKTRFFYRVLNCGLFILPYGGKV